MITLITAVPGSGKTLTAIGIIIKALEEGRPVYTNINGLQVDKFPNNHNLHPAPDDWRDTPEGSLVIYDECQQPHLYPSTAQRGRVEDERLTAMETHRHTGHDLVFITQAPTFVHHHVRKLVGEHIHLYRGRGIGGAMRYEWSHTCDSPNDRKEQERANSEFWKFPKEHYSYYKSATVHTHKFKVPKKLAMFLVGLLIAAVWLASYFWQNKGFASLSGEPVKAVAAAETASREPAALPSALSSRYSYTRDIEQSVPIGGCIANEFLTECQCYSPDGVTLDISVGQCVSIIQKPLPRQIILSNKS